MLRVAGSLQLGTVSASTLIRALQGGGRPTTIYTDDESYRRRIQTQLNRGEG